MSGRLLSAPEVAELIGMRVDFVYKLSRQGGIPCIKFGRTYRYRREAIDDWLLEQERGNHDPTTRRTT